MTMMSINPNMTNAPSPHSSPGPHRGGNQSGLREFNERLMLQVIRRASSISKAEIARRTGLTAQTVSVIVNRLLAEGLLRKERRRRVAGKVGQPAVPIALNPDGGVFDRRQDRQAQSRRPAGRLRRHGPGSRERKICKSRPGLPVSPRRRACSVRDGRPRHCAATAHGRDWGRRPLRNRGLAAGVEQSPRRPGQVGWNRHPATRCRPPGASHLVRERRDRRLHGRPDSPRRERAFRQLSLHLHRYLHRRRNRSRWSAAPRAVRLRRVRGLDAGTEQLRSEDDRFGTADGTAHPLRIPLSPGRTTARLRARSGVRGTALERRNMGRPAAGGSRRACRMDRHHRRGDCSGGLRGVQHRRFRGNRDRRRVAANRSWTS